MGEQKPWIDHLQIKNPKPEKSPKEAKLHKRARILGLIAAWLGIPFTFLIFVGANFQAWRSIWEPFLIYPIVTCILRFIILWFALRFPLPGGLILIADGIALLFVLYYIAAPLSLPLISSGILFILTWYEHRRSLQSPIK